VELWNVNFKFRRTGCIRKDLHGWNIRYNGQNIVANGGYGKWFASERMKLNKE